MATTEHFYTGNNSTTSFAFTFPYLSNSDVKVELDNVVKTENSSGQTNNDYTINNTNIVFNSAPGTGVAIHIYRTTNVDSAQAQYAAGSSIRAADLNNNQTQLLYSAQEASGQLIRQGDLKDSIINSAKIVDGSVATGDLADGLITTVKIAADAVTGAKIADDQINSEHYIDASIDTQHIADSQITTAKIANSNVTTAKIADSNVTTAKIAADAITGAKIADDQINSEHYVDGSIDTAHIANSQITSAKIADGTIIAGDLASNAVTTAKITDLNVTTAKIAADAITGAKIADDQINSEHYVDGSIDTAHIGNNQVTTAKIAADAVTNAKIADDQIDSEHYVDGSIDTAHIGGSQVTDAKLASNSVTTSKIADGQVTTVKISNGDVTLAKLANDLKQTTISDSDTQLPTSGAVVDYVAAQLQPFGGFEAVATEVAFPNTQPVSGVAISISDAGGVVVNGSGVSTTGRTVGGSTITINGFPSSLYNETLVAGVGLIVTSTGSSQTYNYHKILGKEDDIKQLSDDINDFNARYRVGSSNPSSALDSGDLFFNTSTGKLLVYNGTNSAWEEAQSIGNYYINTISSYSGTGGNSASFNGSAYRFVLSNPGTTAEQHIVSVNGVVQKPNSGTSQPGEGFAIDGSSIIFSSAPASGSDFFIITIGSTVNIGTPSDNTVTTAKLTSGAVTTVKIADDAVTAAKIADNLDLPDGNKIRFGTGNDLSIEHDGNHSYINEQGTGDLFVQSNGGSISFQKFGTLERLANFITDGAVELFHDSSKKIETTSWGAQVSGNFVATGLIDLADGNGTSTSTIALGDSDDLKIYHDGSHSYIKNGTGNLNIRTGGTLWIDNSAGTETYIKAIENEAVQLYYDNSKKFETTNLGAQITGELSLTTHLKLLDNQKVVCGNGEDLLIYHDGTHNYVNFVTGALIFQNNGTSVAYFHNTDGHFLPWTTNTFDLGSSGNRWRNVYTNDLHLSNEGSSNDVDSTWGDWTIQEGESDLFLKNNRSGKKYKFNLTEVL
ncbi:hypothetical protein PRSG_00016 [Prochlorococcus phage P-SSP3]|uniref:Bacteriophage T7 tail fibre protein-like N-terminal domain-containing protein n=1 Tax=Prochlorococcus phage P-SSP3 TaxID=382273 RepID=M1T3A6_9CAUD|nr:hypothetical protein PRSG_00016 [Prochlorococcus phage P-SSP3]AGG54570.1 hypothetical protein PRSG_00016 [Prochlorococcus phage P-SSP3]